MIDDDEVGWRARSAVPEPPQAAVQEASSGHAVCGALGMHRTTSLGE